MPSRRAASTAGRDDVDFLAAEIAAVAGVRIESGDGDARRCEIGFAHATGRSGGSRRRSRSRVISDGDGRQRHVRRHARIPDFVEDVEFARRSRRAEHFRPNSRSRRRSRDAALRIAALLNGVKQTASARPARRRARARCGSSRARIRRRCALRSPSSMRAGSRFARSTNTGLPCRPHGRGVPARNSTSGSMPAARRPPAKTRASPMTMMSAASRTSGKRDALAVSSGADACGVAHGERDDGTRRRGQAVLRGMAACFRGAAITSMLNAACSITDLNFDSILRDVKTLNAEEGDAG